MFLREKGDIAKTGIIILAHGSRGEKGAVEVPKVLQRIAEGVRPFLSGRVEVIGAALQFNRPSLEEAVELLLTDSVKRIVIMPYFLFPGRHITEHVPQLIENFKRRYPQVQFAIANTLGPDESFVGLTARRIAECAPDLLSVVRMSLVSPQLIEQRSMEIVEGLLPPLELSREERVVVKRLVHTAGDRDLASLIRFQPVATTMALTAIRLGRPIFTDVRMVSVAINRHLAEKFGCEVYCALDELELAKITQEEGSTRSGTAFRVLGERLNEAIVAIGNSPTALLALLELVSSKKVTPALVVGTPVGFVQAKESKEELMKLDIPYISIVGTRGGSALAGAAVNALLGLAERSAFGEKEIRVEGEV